MKKRILSVFLSIAAFMSCFTVMPANAANEMKKSDVAIEAGLLQSIGIIDAIPEEIDGNKTISRAEFVVLAGKLLKINDSKESVRYFEDVPLDYWGAPYINRLTEMNIISLPGDKMFRPNDRVTESEAVKILVSILGYGDYAELIGGYPNGYSQVASRLDFEYLGSGDTVTVYEAYVMMYDALNSYIYEKRAAGSGQIQYEESDETLLSRYFDVLVAEGVVTQSAGVSLYGEPIKGETFADTAKIVVIDGVQYTSDVDLYDYLGRYTRVYYFLEDEDATPHIVIREDYKKEDYVLEVDYEEYIGYENGVFSYYDEKQRRDNIEIPESAVLIVNGEIRNKNTIEVFDKYEDADKTIEKKGKIRLIDTDDNNSIDYCIISNYKNVFVASVNATTSEVFDVLNPGTAISFDEEEKQLCIEDAKGNLLDFSAITKDTLLTVYDSDSYSRIIVNNAGVNAKIIEMKQEEDKVSLRLGTKEADSEWYEIDEYYYNNFVKGVVEISAGASVAYYLDAFGNVAYITGPTDTNWQIGWLVKLNQNEDDDTTNMKIFMQDGTMQRYTLKEKVVVDGVMKKSYDDIYSALNKITVQGKQNVGVDNPKNPNTNAATSVYDANEHEVFGQVIRIKRNADGEVTHIDSEYYNAAHEEEKTLQRTVYRKLDGTKGYHWLWKARAYAASRWTTATVHDMGYTMFFNAETIRFRVPTFAEMETASDNQYQVFVASNLDLGEENGNRDVDGFKIGFDSGYEKVIVRYEGTTDIETSVPCLVGSVGKTVADDGETVEAATIYPIGGSGASTILAYNETSFIDASDSDNPVKIAKGDVITYKKNAEGKVAEVVVYHDYSEYNGKTPESKQGWIRGDAGQSDNTQVVCAYVKRFVDDIAYIRYPGAYLNKPFSADELTGDKLYYEYDVAMPLMGGTAWVFDGHNVVSSTVAAEIEAAEVVGFENARPAYFSVNISRINGGIFYKNAE